MLRGTLSFLTGTGELSSHLAPQGDASMLACGREGGGGVVLRPCGIEVSASEEASLEQRD